VVSSCFVTRDRPPLIPHAHGSTQWGPDEAEHRGDLPCLLGLYGCLERVRFAIAPRTERFYFCPAAEVS